MVSSSRYAGNEWPFRYCLLAQRDPAVLRALVALEGLFRPFRRVRDSDHTTLQASGGIRARTKTLDNTAPNFLPKPRPFGRALVPGSLMAPERRVQLGTIVGDCGSLCGRAIGAARTFRTDVACRCQPRGALMPRALSASAVCRSDVAPIVVCGRAGGRAPVWSALPRPTHGISALAASQAARFAAPHARPDSVNQPETSM
jgi:hypothetical protein